MAGRALIGTAPILHEVRCACEECGAHVIAWQCHQTLGGRCSTCGSYEIRPLAPAAERPAA